jgi:ribonuclease R
MVTEQEVLKLVTSRRYREMRSEELARALSVGEAETGEFVALLEELERRGQLVRVKKAHWVNPDRAGLVVGRLQCNPRGFGFVLPVREEGEDVHVAQEDMGEAMHDDLVVVELQRRARRGGRRPRKDLGPSGRIIKVIEHRSRRLIGTFVPGEKFGRVVPDNPRFFRDIFVAREDWAGAEEGHQVLVELTAWPSLHMNPVGEVREVLGRAGDPEVDLKSVILEFGLPRGFPPKVTEAAARLSGDVPPEERRSRRDLRQYCTVTIDPEDAKDYDDALSFYRDPRTGRRVVLVHIADLSYHVRPGDVLDHEAQQRGMSVYLANAVVPMLPHEQSKEILSLVEGKDRVAKTAVLEFDDQGELRDYSLCYSVVNIDRRMTYTEVQAALDALEAEEPARRVPAEKLPETVLNLLVELDALAGQLRRRRQQVGSVDLDMPEYDVRVDDDGRVVSVTQVMRDRSHGLVEEFMLSANRAVADFLQKRKLPGLYRVHDSPDKEDAEEFAAFVETVLGRRVDPLDRRQLQALLAEVAGTHVAEAVNMQLLRSMQRALYRPQCRPHYALHFDRYCHFTSPVRRYPDLVVHQILDQFLKGGEGAGRLRRQWKDRLERIAAHCNEMQDRADEAEREIVRIKLLRYLEDHKAEVFDGVVTGVQEYGVFVRLEGYSVEGLVKVQDIAGDFYKLDERRKALVGTRTEREFRLGQPVRVAIKEINMARRQLDLLLQESSSGAPQG